MVVCYGQAVHEQPEQPVHQQPDIIRPACLPEDPEETFGSAAGIITGWGYSEKTKVLKPRPLTTDVLREAEVFILPKVGCCWLVTLF
jgi:hypothetical protein